MGADAGARLVRVPAEEPGEPFPMLVLYPAAATAVPTRMGPYTLDVAMDAAPAAGAAGVVVVSHGSGGSHLTHRLLGTHLAREGFVVLLPVHPRNNRDDDTLAGTAAILERRPRDVRAALDWVQSSTEFGAVADTTRAGVVGHSLGGYTALAVAGGRPVAFAHETAERVAAAVPVAADPRVAALVLLAPATPWFMGEGALRDVQVPTLMFTAEHDRQTPAEHGAIVSRGVTAAPLEHRIVAGAGHYSFLAPFPPEMTSPAFPPSQDPPGFDRAAFHADLYPEIAAFLRRSL